jgi:hypothetical protein
MEAVLFLNTLHPTPIPKQHPALPPSLHLRLKITALSAVLFVDPEAEQEGEAEMLEHQQR